MKRAIYILAILSGSHLTSCAAPSEPAALQSSGTDTSKPQSTSKKVEASASTVDYGGAMVADAATQTTVKTCVSSGMFFERRANPTPSCTTMPLAKIACTSAKIKDVMSATTKTDYEKIMAGELSGYMLDQCVDCSSPVGNAYCEGSGTVKKNYPGIRIFMVKEISGSLDIKTLYIPK